MLKHGIELSNQKIELMYTKPATTFNPELTKKYSQNIFSVMEEVWASDKERIDVVIFLNGLAIMSFELKCNAAGQSYQDAIYQFRTDRNPKTRLFRFKAGTLVNFAMDLEEVYMTTKLDGQATFFLPFNMGKGHGVTAGAGNPAFKDKYSVSYMWEDILTKDTILDLITKEEMIEFASKYKNIEAFKDFDDETTYWFIMLFILLMYIDYNTQKLWESFAEEVKTKNRFFPESELLKKISDIAEKATCTISKGDILYRARDYTKQDFFKNDMVIALSEIMKDEFSNLEFDATDIFNESAMNIASIYLCGDEEKRRRITEKIDNLLNNKKDFYGFDKSNSDAPPNAYAKEGRANPKGISYLYTAKDIKTAILEMRPQMQKMYNIATIEIIRDAKIFDFTYSPEKIKEDEYSIVADLQRISEEFSKPNFGDQIEYAPTQFLCEYIKRLGFDGIKFKSAVSATGTNVLLFDVDAKTRVYDITGSKVYTVNTLDIDISQVNEDV